MSLPAYVVIDGVPTEATTVAGEAFVARFNEQTGVPVDDSSPAPSKEELEIMRLRSKCEAYRDYETYWRFMLLSYEGGPKYVSPETLFKHQRENIRDYNDRLQRAYFLNLCQPLVDFVPEFIFSQGVERHPPKALDKQFEALKENCDRAGSSLNQFMQHLGEVARIFGVAYLHVDKLPPPEEIDPETLTLQKAAELKIDVPYFVLVSPLEVYDWQHDTLGNFTYLKRVQYRTELDTDFTTYRDLEDFYEWTPSQLKVSTVDCTDRRRPRLIRSGPTKPNPWKIVPFIPAYFKRSKSDVDMGQSFLQDIAYQNREVFNLTSLLGEFLYRQCFNVLVLPQRTTLPTRDSVEGDLGTSNVLEVPADAQQGPEYLSPPVDPAEFLQGERAQIIQQMYQQAAQDIMSDLFKGQARSGDAQKQAFSRTIPVINKTADMLEQVERRAFALWTAIQGKEWDGKISYRDDYSVTNLIDLLLQLTQIFNSIHLVSPTFVRAEWKRIVHEFDGKLDSETMAKIVAEIDKMSDDDIKDMLTGMTQMKNDIKAKLGVPSTGDMVQGVKQKRLGTDKRIALSTGSRAATKESAPDANRRAKRGASRKT